MTLRVRDVLDEGRLIDIPPPATVISVINSIIFGGFHPTTSPPQISTPLSTPPPSTTPPSTPTSTAPSQTSSAPVQSPTQSSSDKDIATLSTSTPTSIPSPTSTPSTLSSTPPPSTPTPSSTSPPSTPSSSFTPFIPFLRLPSHPSIPPSFSPLSSPLSTLPPSQLSPAPTQSSSEKDIATPPPSTSSLSSPPPSDSSPAPVQSSTPPNSIGGSSSPSTGSSSDNSASPSSGSNGSFSASSGGSSSGGGASSSPSSTTPPENESSLGISPSTVTSTSILSGDGTSSFISSARGGSLNSASTSFSGTVAHPIMSVGTGSSTLPHTIPAIIISGSPSVNDNPSSTNSPNGAGPSNSVSSTLTDPHHQLSSGEIAAIIIVLIFFITLPIIIFILRRRSKIHKADHGNRWFANTRTSQLYGDGVTEQLIPGGHTARSSSFGNAVDHSEPSRPMYAIPPFPPAMAEMGRGNATGPALVINIEGNTILEENRCSVGSACSDQSQFLIVNHRNSTNLDQKNDPDRQATTPMSVRPFSPPKPPEPAAAGSSRPTSCSTSVTFSSPFQPPGLSSIPSSTVPNTTKSPSFTRNSFRDPTTLTMDNSSYSDIPVDVIRRTFEPTLPDELAVNLDDRVRVLQTFDDGWGLIEIIRRDGREGERGLIPMACLRKELDELGTKKRSSSCEGPYAI